jgi:hypothetical protein
MSYLQENNTENLAARITYKGRQKIAQGDFNISYFQIGDSEFDYNFSVFDGITLSGQKVLTPLDKDSQVKYPYKVSESTLTGTTYGVPSQSYITKTISNNIAAAGYVSEYVEFDSDTSDGTTVECDSAEVSFSLINGTSALTVPDGTLFYNTNYITIYTKSLGINDVITDSSMSLVYKITGVTGNVVYLDRNMPDLSSLSGNTTVIRNSCDGNLDIDEQQDPWTLNVVWGQNPVGLDPYSSIVDERLSGYTSNAYTSSKEYFGYNNSSGQTSNTSTTITNSFSESIIVPPEEQHSLAIIHYTQPGNSTDPYATFKYEDYIDHTDDGVDYFEIYIPFIFYERNSGTTIGARFFMDTVDYYINSSATDTRNNQMKFRYLIDEFNIRVGKVFVNHKVIIFDDQEIVAALDYKSNRRYTLPIPKISAIPTDSKCETYDGSSEPLLGGTGDTVFVTYVLEYSGDTGLNGMACNYYNKITGTTTSSDVSIKFNSEDFRFLQSDSGISGAIEGYIANIFKILVQKVDTGNQPDPTQWREVDFTDQIPNHIVGDLISSTNLQGTRFIITYNDYDNASIYTMEDPDIADTSTSGEFGDEQPFTGSIKATRSTDFAVLSYLINLPSTDFMVTQNPTYIDGLPKRITEVALLDDNKDIMVIAKATSPIVRIGTQVLSVKIDI